MKRLLTNKWFKNYIILFVFLFLIEILFKLCGSISIFNATLLRIFLSTNIIAVVISFIEIYCSKTINLIINFVVVSAASIYALAQLGFENFLGVYISLGTSSQLGAVIEYIREYLLSFKIYYWVMLLPICLMAVYYIFLDKKIFKELPKLNKEYQKKDFLNKGLKLIISIIVLCGAYFGTLKIACFQNKFQTISNTELFKTASVPSIAIKQFGASTYGIIDVKNYLFPSEEAEISISYEKKEHEITDYSRNIDDTLWEELIKTETNKTYQNLNNYFISQSITPKNEYTGLFKNKNVIFIMMESVGELIINEEYFPNFYKLYNEGWTWSNNYSPRNSCATGNNEMSGMVSLYTIYNSCTANNYKNNTYFESVFNVFKNANYETSSMHNYTEAYYRRSKIHLNMGSEAYYGVQSLGLDYSNQYKEWASDEEFINAAMDILLEKDSNKPFMTWLTTVTSHQPYGVSSEYGDLYLDKFKDTDLPKNIQRYYSKLTVLDNALGLLIERLKEAGKLDDTVIVLYGDHYPYGIPKDDLNLVLDYNLDDYETERTPFVIYNSSLEPKKFTEYTSYMNILPTVANLFDLEYDPRLYMGTDLLSDEYKSLVVFADGSWKNELAYYNASTGNIKYYTNSKYNVEEVQKINEEVTLKIQMSNLAIKNNYFAYLEKAFNNEKSNKRIAHAE